MIHDSVFPPLNQHVLREKLETLSLADLIAVTLIDSNVLLGGIFGFWENVWSEEKAVALIFNTKKGERFGDSRRVHIPANSISDVSIVPLDDSSTPQLNTNGPQAQFLLQVEALCAKMEWTTLLNKLV